MARKTLLWALVCLVLVPGLALGQQTGTISGKVTDSGGLVLPGVTVDARSDSLPAPRVTVTGGAGEYRLPALQPGNYTVTFELQGMGKITRQVSVQLAQDTVVEVVLSVAGVAETVNVTAEFVPVIEKDSTALKSSVSTEAIQSLPVGQEYRDLIKLIPGVQYTQDSTRGPAAGGSGQDNVYKFDGVNVTLPLFGTLSAEPASHDVAQVTTIKGGAKALDFDRAGGFTVDSISKSGTAKFAGMLSYQLQNAPMAAALNQNAVSRYDQDRTWVTANLGGPVWANKAYFYGSYYRPTRKRQNASNAYGQLPSYESTRNEGFGKLTFTPVSQVLVNVSWRQSHRLDVGDTFGAISAGTLGSGSEAWQKIGIAEASWVVNARSFATFKYTHFENPTKGRPDHDANVTISTTPGTRLDVNALDTAGQLTVPVPRSGETAFNAFIQPLIDRYGYVDAATGAKKGGGVVGYGLLYNNQDFFRDAVQFGYNLTLGSELRHDLHAGVQWYVDSEDLLRTSNGWGAITVPGGRVTGVTFNGVPAYYMAQFQQQSIGAVPTLHSEYRSTNLEFNDTVNVSNFSFNLGVLMSLDKLYGEGLKKDASTVSGFVKADPSSKYNMYTVPFGRTMQPRAGATWSYNGRDTAYASFARYVPAASSLPRAASWARNAVATMNAYFDQNGVLYGVSAFPSSTGKMFQPDMSPRRTDEYLIGTARQFRRGITGRAYYRYRRGSHFWEDTNNDARVSLQPPPGIPGTLYIPQAVEMMKQLGASTATNASTYVIAELDGAYTKYQEATVEVEWRARNAFVRTSYSWTRYRGNFDQDNTSTANDDNTFMGSSNIGDGAGRQLWNFKDGILRGDRPMMFKLYGFYQLPWSSSIGAYVVGQSGQPWEVWSYEPYIALTNDTSDTARFAEPAGSRRTDSHYQLDLNYTQDVRLTGRSRFQVAADLFNVFNRQTPYNIDPRAHSGTFESPRSWMDPRRLQIAARFLF